MQVPGLRPQRQLCHQTTKFAKKHVLISRSTNIYENLALEDWLFKNWNYDNKEVLFLWINSPPCVVFGRHQNPWNEANLDYLCKSGILPARRNSGGGTVYHDKGNLNCTFFTTRINYNRMRNLSFICNVLKKQWGLDVNVSNRDDILLGNKFKISGTASKLASKNAYHHCTLLINTEFRCLSQTLQPPQIGIKSTATNSVSSTVTNISFWNSNASLDAVQQSLCQEFLSEDAIRENIQYILPDETKFPGWAATVETFKNWDWIFGKTPKFCTVISFGSGNLHFVIESGRIVDIKYDQPPTLDCSEPLHKILLGSKLCHTTLDNFCKILESNRDVIKPNIDISRVAEVMMHLCATNV